MTDAPRPSSLRWLRHAAWVLTATVLLCAAAGIFFFGSGLGNPLLHRLLVQRLEMITGGRVEIQSLSIGWLSTHAMLKGVVIRGGEPAGTPPFFSAEEVEAGLRIDSFWGRKVSLKDLLVRQPHIHIRVEANGSTNVPVPARARTQAKSLRETLFDLYVRHIQLENGWILYNDVKTPLAVEGDNFSLVLDAGDPAGHPLYVGELKWQNIRFTALKYLPIPASLSAKFTMSREGFTLEQGVLSAGRSHMDAHAELDSFTDPHWKFTYRGWVDLLDFRETLREPLVPAGRVDVRGETSVARGQFRGKGSYSARDITLPYAEFHAAGLTSRGDYRFDNQGLEIPDFFAGALGGSVKGRVTLRFNGMQFVAVTRTENVRLAALLPHIEHPGFPVDKLHWDALLTADTVETWTAAFRHFEISGQMNWAAPKDPAAGHQPVTADWEFRYRYDSSLLTVVRGSFETPSSRGTISGLLAPRDSALNVKFETGALETYQDFINAIRGAAPGSAEARKQISGNVTWEGKIIGPGGGPTFLGHLRGENIRYDSVALNSVDGDLTYSPTQLKVTNGHLRHEEMAVSLDASLTLTKWSFLPENSWSGDFNFEKTPIESIEGFLGRSYPARGQLTAQFHGRGTRNEPEITGLFDLADSNVYGISFIDLRGQLNISQDEVRITNAELRFFPAGKENGRGAGIITGSASYSFAEKSVTADLVGASLPLDNFEKLQSSRLPIGGQLSFRLKAKGPATAPQGDGSFRVVDLRVGQEVVGSFDGTLNSDGRIATFQLTSAMSTGELTGTYTLGLSDPFPLNGKASIKNIDLDPFLLAALHLKAFSGHGKADGDIAVKGNLKQAQSLVVEANFSRLVLNYANVQLENTGPVRFRSSGAGLEIERVTLHGADTDVQIEGAIQFSGRRTMGLRVNGTVNLGLITGFAPGIDTRGAAQINAAVEGTMDHPRINGHVHIENTSLRAVDFPTGLSAIKGDFVFDATRLFFSDAAAEVGGGTLRVSGSVNYAERPIRFDLNTTSERVRIRYPEGMSWLVGGTLRLTGTPGGGVLSGRVAVERVTLTQGLESAGVLISGREGISGPTTNSSFLRNLQFDVEAASTPDARMEWPSAELEAEANLRVRGTWEHPILLGHIHILSGDLYFSGNHYRVARGDINFANPFRLDPVLNIEATTSVQQYEITLNFNGPASKLSLAYRSDPPLPANDIVTLLALGQTSAEAKARTGGLSQGPGSGATALLSEAISSQLGGRLERLFGITRFRVDPDLTGVGATGSSQNAGARVTVEQRVTRNLTITYVSNVTSTQQQVIQVEYNVNRNVSVVALRDQNGTFGIDVKIRKRFP